MANVKVPIRMWLIFKLPEGPYTAIGKRVLVDIQLNEDAAYASLDVFEKSVDPFGGVSFSIEERRDV